MMRKVAISGIVWVIVLASAAAAAPEKQQDPAERLYWLSYRTASRGWVAVRGTAGQTIELAVTAPQGLAEMEFTGSRPLFGKWKTPLAAAGHLWVSLDSSQKDGPYDRLWIDANGDGQLADNPPAAAARTRTYRGRQSAEFQAVKVMLPGDDGGPTAFHLNFRLEKPKRDKAKLTARAAGWYEGRVPMRGKKWLLTLFDADANGCFSDARCDWRLSDRIRLTDGDTVIVGRAGKYLQIGPRLHRLTIARDGCSVRLAEPKAVEMGTVDVSGLTAFSAGGANGLLFPQMSDGVAKLPIGAYRLRHWEIETKDKWGTAWKLSAAAPAKPVEFVVGQDNSVALTAGPPVVTSVTARRQGSTWAFSNPRVVGRAGEAVTLTRNGRRPPAPMLRIRNADDSYNRRFTFEYG